MVVGGVRESTVEGFPETLSTGRVTRDEIGKNGLIRVIIGSGDGLQDLFHHPGVSFLVFS